MKLKNILTLGTGYTYPLWLRYLEISSVIIFGCLAYFHIGVIAQSVSNLGVDPSSLFLVLMLLAIIGLGTYLIADFVSGVVHCAADNFGSPQTPFFGIALIMPFREHHRDPDGITQHDFLETNGNSCLVCLMPLAFIFFIQLDSYPLLDLALRFGILSFCIFILLTNQFHKWAHSKPAPKFVSWMQNRNIILNPNVHQVHHTQPFDRYYCITNGWLNPILDRIKFFEKLVSTGHAIEGKKTDQRMDQPTGMASLKMK